MNSLLIQSMLYLQCCNPTSLQTHLFLVWSVWDKSLSLLKRRFGFMKQLFSPLSQHQLGISVSFQLKKTQLILSIQAVPWSTTDFRPIITIAGIDMCNIWKKISLQSCQCPPKAWIQTWLNLRLPQGGEHGQPKLQEGFYFREMIVCHPHMPSFEQRWPTLRTTCKCARVCPL